MGNRNGGTPRKPKALAVIEGYRSDRINDAEPVPGDGAIPIPSGLSQEARRVWDRLAPDLISKKVLTAWDTDSFGSFCDAVARHRQAAARLDDEGEVVEGHRGVASKNPWFQIWRDTADVMTRLGGRFGLNPSDRAGLSVGGDDGDEGKSPQRLLS